MSYDQMLISDLEIMAKAINYQQWMYRRLAPFLGQRVLEIGAGIGNFTRLLLDCELIVATDNYPPCVEYLCAYFAGRSNILPQHLDIEANVASELREYRFDTIVCLNVLEHIENDTKALSQMSELLELGGCLVLLVPAFQFLYGTVDRALGHYRRYTRAELLLKIARARFEVERSFYMNMIGMAGWFWNNRVVRRSEESAKQIRIFDRYIAPVAERAERLLPPPVGLSLIAIGRKGQVSSSPPLS